MLNSSADLNLYAMAAYDETCSEMDIYSETIKYAIK